MTLPGPPPRSKDGAAVPALADAELFIGEEINLIGDFVSDGELCDTLRRIRKGETFTYKTAYKIVMRVFAKEFCALRIALEEFGRLPYSHDVTSEIQQCGNLYPKLLSVEQYLLSQGFDLMKL